MQRVPLAEFEPALNTRIEELRGDPVNLYRVLGNHPALGMLEALTAGRVDDATWQAAAREFSLKEMMELVLTAGFYSMVARVLDALRVPLDGDIRDYAPRLA